MRRKSAELVKTGFTRRDMGVVAAFVGAISILILVAGYAVFRITSERAYRKKWEDYNDCGWA